MKTRSLDPGASVAKSLPWSFFFRRAGALASGALVLAAAGPVAEPSPSQPGPQETPDAYGTYAEVDAALEGEVLLAADAVWRYFVGTEDPAPEFDWGQRDFDDSAWLEGPAPFGFGGDRPVGTTIDAIGEGVSTVYLRRELVVEDRAKYERILLELPIDDGYVLFVRGLEEDRLSAEKFTVVNAFDAHATSMRDLETPPMPVFDLTPTVKDLRTQLALQTLVHEDDAHSYGFRPRVWAQYAITPEGEAERRRAIGARIPGPGALRAYLEGRHLQRLGDPAGAIEHLARAAALDPTAREPWRRLQDCHRAQGSVEALADHLLGLVRAGVRAPAVLDALAELHLIDLGRSPSALLSAVGQIEDLLDRGLFADALWSAELSASGAPLRIDCGADDDSTTGGDAGLSWSRDRCHRDGQPTALEGEGIGASVRDGTRGLDDLVSMYEIPLDPGAYELRLTFEALLDDGAQAGEAALDVLVEGARAWRDLDPSLPAPGDAHGLRSAVLPLRHADTVLQLDFLPQSIYLPRIAGIELTPISEERFSELASAAVERTKRASAYALVQLAESLLAAQDETAAFALFEEAERLPDFMPVQAQRLGAVRDGLLPRVLTWATAEDLVARHGDRAGVLLDAVRAAGEDREQATYMQGHIELAAGRYEGAIGAFESLVGEGVMEPEVWYGMAYSMARAGLVPEAMGILEEALDLGVAVSDELFQLWISLELMAGTDPWELLAELRAFDPPQDLWVVPTSELAPSTWRYTAIEPPANAWSRPTYEDGHWNLGPAGFGSGHTVAGGVRSHWNTEKLFARQPFEVLGGQLLYPHVDVHANDAADVYMNGTRVSRISIATRGYVRMSLAQPNLTEGANVLGLFGFNVRDSSGVDVGLVQPIGTLSWIADELADDGAIRLNCGGERYVGADGRVWSADRMYGWAYATEAQDPELDILGSEDDALLRTNRWFYDDAPDAWYHVPLPNGGYRVTLHFAEVDPAFAEAGTRSFDVRLESELVLEALDLAQSAGFATLATHAFDTEVTDGFLDLLINDKEHRSFLSALEIERIGT